MPDRDLFEIFHAPQKAVLTHSAQVKRRNTETFTADFRIPGVETPKIEIGIAIGQASRLNRMRIIHEE
ncbi:hypothetical protein GLUCOINTEAF2_0204129 [Komagataeibacter intermedius AF2]|uniref:Uncharacterized protein n=1 Tax=Komagataeibacter intermedius AF2 TaxID=1458464 RepID=A0A0N1FAC6_9PROT|nr:hypothetical protein GLUCOINTEAF2_0204129 [Komagataeibacter intermedius AF2]